MEKQVLSQWTLRHNVMTPDEFYDQFTPFYHLIYPDWDASMTQQAAALDSIMQEFWGAEARTILDVACGIGTQAWAWCSWAIR